LEAKKGNTTTADHLYSRSEDVTEGLLVGILSRQVEASLIGNMSEVYLGHFELALRLHNIPEAFQVLESARGRSISDSLRGHGNPQAPDDPVTSDAVKEINHLQTVLLHANTREERTTLLDKLFEAEQRLAPTGHPHTLLQRVTMQPVPEKLQAVQRSLHADETVLEYVLGESRSYCLYLTRTGVGVSTLPEGKAQVESLARQYLDEIKSKKQDISTGCELFDLLFKPLPRQALKLRLVIVPDGELNLLPFDSLVDEDGKYLLASHIVTSAPSATVLYLIRTSPPATPPRLTFLGLGDVQYQQGPSMTHRNNSDSIAASNTGMLFDLAGDPLQNLPRSRDEIEEAAKILGPRSVELLGADATEAAFKAEPLDQFRIIHIAAHAIASTRFPERSALVLGEDPKKQEDGLLQAREVQNLRLNADLVTLSACDTGAGRLWGEEGIASLERSFLFAGARSVLASLWTASDPYAMALVRHFYRHLAAGLDEGAALREAKLDLIKEFRSEAGPYYWAGFNLVGDASAPIPSLGK
jgi:CHAT domain-containing protein